MSSVDTESLKRLATLVNLPAQQLERLGQSLVPRTVKKGAIIFDQGEKAVCIYVLLAGVVKLSYNNQKQQTTVSMLSPGDFFGFDSLVPQSFHPFCCSAYETSTVGLLKPAHFVEIMFGASYDEFLPGFAATMHLDRQLYVHCIRGIALDLRRRLALELVNLADRFGVPDRRGTIINLAISHETLAETVGASRQQVTQYLNEFDRDGMILREGRRIIVRAERLRREQQ